MATAAQHSCGISILGGVSPAPDIDDFFDASDHHAFVILDVDIEQM
jgi:hypothetical protein